MKKHLPKPPRNPFARVEKPTHKPTVGPMRCLCCNMKK